MSVIIRLQNLPWSANAADIRQYFQGLSIPEGGVHIVGGEKGDAFISFSTDEDARQAMLSDGGCINEVQIRLLLSSRNEMQKVIDAARQQSMQLTHVFMQQMQQPPQMPQQIPQMQPQIPQLPIIGSLPPLTAKVLPQPQQQQVRPDRLVSMLRRHQPIMDSSAVYMCQEKQQQQQQQQHLSPKPSDREDKSSQKRERTRSKSRDRRSKSSRSGGGSGSSRRERSRSRDRRRRDRSRGRERSRDRYRSDGRDRNSSSRGSGGKSHRSKSPVFRGTDSERKVAVTVGDQQTSVRPWTCQYDGLQQQQQVMGVVNNNLQPTEETMKPLPGGATSVFSHFRTPPQPPIIPILAPNAYQPPNNKWNTRNEAVQQPYVPDNDFRDNKNVYDGGSDDEDDRQVEYNNSLHRRFNDNGASDSGSRRGPPGQDFRDQGFGPNRGPRFHRPQQQSVPGGQQNRGGHQHQTYDEYEGGNRGPRFNHQQPPRYGGRGMPPSDGGGRPSRFNLIQDGGRPSRFNPVSQHRGDSVDSDDSKRPPPRYNDRYRYDVRNTNVPQVEGLCVEVNNMSSHFSYGDVRKLFEGIHIDGSAIKIQKHRQGVAFVRFDNNQNKNLAMRVSGSEYKGNNVLVKHLDDEAYERENTDDRPYPKAVAATTATTTAVIAPTVVDHVDLVDDDDEDENNDNSDQTAGNKKQNDKQLKKSVEGDDCNLVTSEKNTKDSGEVTTEDGSEKPSTAQSQNSPTKYLKLKQLPITVTEDDVLNEMGGGDEVRRVTFYPDGEFMGAALEFQSVDAAESALKRFDCVLLGSTPVPVLRCTYKEYVQIKRKSGGGSRRFSSDVSSGGGGGGKTRHHHHHSSHHHHHHQQQHQSQSSAAMPLPPSPPNLPLSPAVRSNCLYVYGLPTTVTNTDIMKFFGETSVLPDKIHIMLNKFGRPTGESYCEFGTVQQAQAASANDQRYMGPNLVYVEPINRSDMIQAITKPMQQHNHHHQDMTWTGGVRGGGGGGPRQPHANMISSSSARHQGPPNSYGGAGGGGGVHNGPYGGGGGGGGRPQYMNNGGGGGASYTPRMRGPGPGPNTGPEGFGQPGCVVALDNVPYRADVQEIVDFFDGFELNIQNVIRRFNDFGKPTGEARVNLRNPQEAVRAVRVLQNKPIHNRPVHLTLL